MPKGKTEDVDTQIKNPSTKMQMAKVQYFSVKVAGTKESGFARQHLLTRSSQNENWSC